MFYLDDGTLGGSLEDIAHDLEVIKKEACDIGLELNANKSEVISINESLLKSVQFILPGIREVDSAKATLLGSLIGDTASISDAISAKTLFLQLLGERLQFVSSRDAYLLLRYSIAVPKLLYCLRTCPCFLSPSLKLFDDELRSIMCSVFNLPLSEGHPAWVQATLPVKSGGLGIQSVVQLAPSAFLASAAACSSLVQLILPPHLINPFSQALMKHFSHGLRFPTNYLLPVGPASCHQKAYNIKNCTFSA